MLISHERKFIFIHVPKAAGTSVQGALNSLGSQPSRCLANRLMIGAGLKATKWKPTGWQRFGEHATAKHVRSCLGRAQYEMYFTAAFVRNPWDWLVSRYHYDLQTPTLRRHERVKQLGSLAAFAEYEAAKGSSQHRFVANAQGRVIVNFVGRFERLEEDFDRLCEKLNVDVRLPKLNASNHRPYQAHYNGATRRLVERLFAQDVAMFEYTFDERRRAVNAEREIDSHIPALERHGLQVAV
ncbi:MAG TPA: sulfotransferase family 2 domain-containing protein [Phycisphaerales bacterium]|nr:sulfotransferase family 2 domain-containing protein [Phycisphaerales bacterium]